MNGSAYVLFLWLDSIPLISSSSFVGEQTATYAAWWQASVCSRTPQNCSCKHLLGSNRTRVKMQRAWLRNRGTLLSVLWLKIRLYCCLFTYWSANTHSKGYCYFFIMAFHFVALCWSVKGLSSLESSRSRLWSMKLPLSLCSNLVPAQQNRDAGFSFYWQWRRGKFY